MTLDKLPKTRKEAKEQGSNMYFTAEPCVNGHTEPRYTKTTVCRGCKRDNAKLDYSRNKDNVKTRNDRSRLKNKDRVKETSRKWINANPDKVKEIKRRNKEKYKDIYNKNEWERVKKKKEQDPCYKMNKSISLQIYRFMNGGKLHRTAASFISYSFQDLVDHLESQFINNMSWDNYGTEWVIDHIIPLDYFNKLDNLSLDDKVRCAWKLENLRPLHPLENASKGAKILHPELIDVLLK